MDCLHDKTHTEASFTLMSNLNSLDIYWDSFTAQSKVVKNCFTYWKYLRNNRNKETNILDHLFSNKEELNGYHIILEFVIRKGNTGQRLMCTEDFKKQMSKLKRKRRSYSTECKSSDYRLKKNIGVDAIC